MEYKFSDNQKINHTLNLVVQNLSHLAEEQLKHIDQLTMIGKSLSCETDLDKIFDLILDEGIAFTKADAATIYMVTDEASALEFEIVYNATMKMREGGSHGPVGWPVIKLFNEDGSPKLSHIVTSVYHSKNTLTFDDVYETKDYDITGTLKTDRTYGYRCKSMITIPLMNHEEEVLGVMQFINAMDDEGNIISFSEEHKIMLHSLASQAAIALSNRKLIEDLEGLLMQFIRSIAVAIERKSKYSSDHIMRVAMLTEMLADKINAATEGHFADIRFNPNELKEISMAGWMHDVGKIITPEFVMDKSRKLERIMDGITLVQERFARLKLLFRHLMHKLSSPDLTAFIQEHINPDLDVDGILVYLDEAQSFVEKLNVGGEFVPDEDIARMEALAAIDFEYDGQRYFLLDELDKKNLSIRRGTLNSEELDVMRAHASITWEMLSELSFPKKYKNVAFYASTHHETLNGKGYPKGLDAPRLPLQSRMIAMVDIFEALTAADRPYKTPKPLSEALMIMANMAKAGHLDPDLLNLFMDSNL
ncbi:MAG TPA: HD domain-containing phosphohydrolase, partial [Candidatus Cloacimonadota bacterium]|nr:HD domain-containing phosphohydrolase [Candidatus Cloacimonadota bacterium]